MPYFLERIAKFLYEDTNGDLRKHCFVFPSRRAGIYFLKYLTAEIKRPVWAPDIMTINEFFGSFSPLAVAENEVLLLELYKIYRRLNASAESFDDFYFWGDMLLSDFDDIDKYMADPSVLFRNVNDFRSIDNQFGDLEEEQAEIIKRFWRNFEPQKPSPQKSDFKFLWSILFDLYSAFNDSLLSRRISYEGMLFRDVVTRIKPWNDVTLKWDQVHFIGFNALNSCEQEIMVQLQKKGVARFYWDYDNSYVRDAKFNSAGLFLSRNLKIFSNNMPADWNYDTLLSCPGCNVVRNIYETTTDISQVKLLPDLIDQLTGLTAENAHHTAVILADESLLVPALTSLPEKVQSVNITMGYPLRMTGVYGFVRLLLDLQRNKVTENNTVYFDYRDVKNLTRHHLTRALFGIEEYSVLEELLKRNLARIPSELLAGSEKLRRIFRVPSDPYQFSVYLKDILMSVSADPEIGSTGNQAMPRKLENEFIYRVFLAVNRLEAIIQAPEVSFKTEIYIRILDKILKSQSVPFTGEPLSGIQVMGILETRALDFKNIILLSVNEGVLPSVTSGSSFIPYSIREAFGLPVINYQESIYAYHFYRLLHRAENAIFIYNSGSEGLKTGEISRFLTQMKYEHIIKPEIRNLSFDIKSPVSIKNELERTTDHQAALYSRYLDRLKPKILSPTAINMWLNCRMKFYYRYVNDLKESQTIPVEIDYALFGSMLHNVMRHIYKPFSGMEITRDMLGTIMSDRNHMASLIDQAAGETSRTEPGIPLAGRDLIVRDVLGIFLSRILEADKSITPFRIIALEESFEFSMPFVFDNEEHTIKTGGNIDRIDITCGTTRIVDYKTGDIARKIYSITDLFEDDRKKDIDAWLQTLLYCEAYRNQNKDSVLKPSIYVVKELTTEKFLDTLRIRVDRNNEIEVNDYNEVRSIFLSGLEEVIKEIFNPEEPFRMTKDLGKCVYCQYRLLCQR